MRREVCGKKEETLCCREPFLRTEDQTVKGAFGDHEGSLNDIEKQDYELLRSQKPTSRSPADIRLRQKVDDPVSAGQFGEENERVMLSRTVTKDGINGENMTPTDNVSSSCKDSKWNSLSPPSSENGRNLVQFMNSASNDIKEAIDRSSLRGSPLVSTITSTPSFDQTIGQCVVREVADRKKCYFHTSRDSSALANPLKVLKVEPLNIVKVKPMGSYICEPSDTCDKKKHIRSQETTFEYSSPSKRPKLSANFNLDKLFDGSKDSDSAETKFSPKTQKDPTCNSGDDAEETFNRDRKDSPSTNPLPLRKRRLPASFWQEPGKSQVHPPRKTVESPSRHTAFMPITPRRDSSSFGRYVKDFLGSSLSASEKLELLRLNSLERDNFNHICSSSPSSSSRDFSDRRCHSYPCVLMHCKKQHEDVSARGNFPSFYPRSDQPLLHAPQGVPSSLSYPTRSIFANHYERHAANILGTPHTGISSHYPEFFVRPDDVIDSSYGSRIIFPFEPNGSPFFPLYSHFNPNVIRPVPKKHLSNMSAGPYHSSFDVR